MRRAVLLAAAFMLAAAPGSAQKGQALSPGFQDAGKLERSWNDVKVEYRERFKEALNAVDKRIGELMSQTDGGDKEKRAAINEQINDLQRDRERLDQRYTELKAATAVDWFNIKNRAGDALEDATD